MPIAHSPQPFRPRAQDSVFKRTLWLVPAMLALVFVALIATWAEMNDAQVSAAHQQTLIADASSVEAQLTGRQEIEKTRLREVASRLSVRAGNASATLATMPEVVAGLDRLWNRLVWLDENHRLVARAERKAPILANATEELRVQTSGQADHLVVPLLDASGRQAGQLLARYEITDLLKSTDLVWLNHRYEVSFLSELGEVIATTANPVRTPAGKRYELPLTAFKDASLRLTPFEAVASWKQNPRTIALLVGLLLLGAAASQLTRHEMRQVARAIADTQNEAAWRQSMEDSALVGLRARDSEGRILYVNKTLCEMVGYSRDELVGLKPPLPFWPPDAVDAMMARNLHTLAGGAPSTGFETRWCHKDGEVLDVMIFESRLVNSIGAHIGWMGSIIDISERKRLEERDRHQTEAMAQHARLNDMGLLASELAHELNQPLTTIASYSGGLKLALGKLPMADAGTRKAVDEIAIHARKAGDIVNWIRRQTSRSDPVRSRSDLNAIVSDVLSLRMRQIQRVHAQLLVDLATGLPAVLVDRIGIEQVLSNLVRNAADALASCDHEKFIRVASSVVQSPNGDQQVVHVSVSDNGVGLRGRTIDMLCTTFYSTKSDGMGLGLGICRSIIESHGGELRANDAPDGGAQFHFTLPITST